MLGNLLDHFIFKSRRFTPRAKAIAFGVISFAVAATFVYFKDTAWGIEGPAAVAMKGRKWRKVAFPFFLDVALVFADILC